MPSHLLRSARLIGALTLVSRVLGLARDMAVTNAFGVSSAASAFWTAFQIPNLFRRLFGEGALSAASIPVLTETASKAGKDAADRLAGRILGLLLVILTGLCIVGEVAVALLYWLFAEDTQNALMLGLTALMLPYMIFICAAAMLGGVQNVFERFASAAAAPLILNVFVIAAAVGGRWIGATEARGVMLLGTAVVISGIFQMAWQWAATRRIGLRLPLSLDIHDPAIRRIGLTMLPMVVGLATVQFNTVADALIAWWFVPEEVMQPGGPGQHVGPTILSLAQRLYQFPIGVFAIALATAIYPALSRHAAESDLAGLGRTLSRGIRIVSFEGLPSMVGLILIREPLVRLLFEHGKFTEWPEAADRVSFALLMYALGIWAFGVNQLVVRTFYALGDAKTPLGVSVRNVGLNLVLNLLLVHTFLREAGLALATTICAVLQAAVLLYRFSRRGGHLEWAPTLQSIGRTAVATVIMAGAVAAVEHALGAAPAVLAVPTLVVTGGISFIGAARLIRCEELGEIMRR
ncbi:MAG: murein biosynthesis integral membrane protein MurJ [Phycisphaerae bacterium]|nr:murein biosynthesis integral membrane protein MurJ [Phycisphaerae bacterium]